MLRITIMLTMRTWIVHFVIPLFFLLFPLGLRAEPRLDAPTIVQELLASDSLTAIRLKSETLGECTVEEAEVRRLIEAAKQTSSDSRRILLWHAIRVTQSQLGREFLLEAIANAGSPQQIEWLHALRNPVPFDIPLLVAVYQSASRGSVSDEASVKEFFVRFAMRSWRDTLVTDWHSTKDTQLYHGVGNRRQEAADAAQLRLLTYLITSGHNLDTKIAAYQYKGHSWFKGFEPAHRQQLALQMFAAAESPRDRARLTVLLRDQIEPISLLKGAESLEVKIAAIDAIGELVADHWRSTSGYDALRKAYRDLLSIAQNEDAPELSRAASKMIRTLEARYGEKATKGRE